MKPNSISRRGRAQDNRGRSQDSNLAYNINQLEAFDPTFHKPLFSVTWGRDIQLRPGLTMSVESATFTRAKFGTPGTQSAAGKPWLTPKSTTIPGVTINGAKDGNPIHLLAREVTYTSVELERSQDLGQPLDVSQLEALNDSYQLETDAMVYVGDTEVDATGLVNSDSVVTPSNATHGGWIAETNPDHILEDINEVLAASWAATGYAVCPSDLLVPPAQFAKLATMKVSSAGNVSVLQYVRDNCISTVNNNTPLSIRPLKWLVDRGVSTTDRMVAYTNAADRVRFPLVPMRREQSYVAGIRFSTPYLWAYGHVEFLYPETVAYRDNI